MIENIEVLCHSSIKLNKEKVIYFDPFEIENEYNDADIIFITHDHYDHYSEKDIKKTSLGILISLIGGAFFPDANTYTSTGFSAGIEAFLSMIVDSQYEGKEFYYRRRIWSNGKPDLSGTPQKYYYKYEVTYSSNKSFTENTQDDSFYSVTKITNH